MGGPVHQGHGVERGGLATGHLGDGGNGFLVQLVGGIFGDAQRAGLGREWSVGIAHGVFQKYEIMMSNGV